MARVRFLLDDRQTIREQRGDLHRLEIEHHLAGFDLGQVEDVVDQREQMLAAAEDVADELFLLVAEIPDQAISQYFGEADDGIKGRPQLVRHVGEEFGFHPARLFQLGVFLLQPLLEELELGDVARRGKYALQHPVPIGDDGERAISGPRSELVVGDSALGEDAFDSRLGASRIGEVVLERRADQLVARTPRQRLHLLVDVGHNAARIRRHQRVDAALDQGPRVIVLVAEALIELHPFLFDLLACGVVGADQQVPDDRILGIAQRGNRDDGGKAALVLPDVSQLVDVLDAARGLEYQRFEARSNLGSDFHAQGSGACYDFLRIGDIRGSDLVHHFRRGVAKHALGADVEDLNYAFGVGGDAGKIGAVEDCVLQSARVEDCLALATVSVEVCCLAVAFARAEHASMNPLDRVLQRTRSIVRHSLPFGVCRETAEEIAPAFGTRRPRFLVACAESRLSRSDRPVDPQRGRAGTRLVDCGQRFFFLDRGCVNVVVRPEGEPQVHQISFHLLSLFGGRRELTTHR